MLRDVLDIYNRHLPSILLISVVLVFPVTFFIQLVAIYVNGSGVFLFPSLTTLCFLLLNFTLLFAPFRLVAMKDLQDEEFKVKELFASFSNNFTYLSLFTIIVYTMTVFGFFLLLIPTALGCAFIFLMPIFADQDSIRKNLRDVWSAIKRENLSILVDMLMIISIQSLLWGVSMLIMQGFENSFLFYIVLRCILNTFLFPTFYFYLTRKYGVMNKNREAMDFDAI